MPTPFKLKTFQKEALYALKKPNHLICVSPTGSGKSLIFEEFVRTHRKARAILVSPLVALARQQYKKLASQGIRCVLASKTIQPPKSGVWILSPENIFNGFSSRTLNILRKWKPTFLIVDEAHCFWDWGDGFRPSFNSLPSLIKVLGIKRSLWLTATLPLEARNYLKNILPLNQIEQGSFAFPQKLHLEVRQSLRPERIQDLVDWIEKQEGQGIVFSSTREMAERLSRLLRPLGATLSYHAGMSVEERKNIEKQISDKIPKIVVATTAFGMGMDHSHLNWVVLWQAPLSLLGLAQLIGRVGRQDRAGKALVLWDHTDFKLNSWAASSKRKKQDFIATLNYLETEGCRKDLLVQYFEGQRKQKKFLPCGACDFCNNFSTKLAIDDSMPTSSKFRSKSLSKSSAITKKYTSNILLNRCQKKAMNLLESDENVFLTGVAGSGKSYLISHYIRKSSQTPKELPILASTGAAAILVGGRTFHSFFGLGIMQGGYDETVKRALKNKKVCRRIKKANGIVIDEVSMLSSETLQAAEEIARMARGVYGPWGGLRVIAVGDFAQLPPVQRSFADGGGSRKKDWAFLGQTWGETDFKPALLKTVVRSKDKDFLKILNYVREGIVNQEVTEFLNKRTKKKPNFGGTRFFPRRDMAESHNLTCLDELDTVAENFETKYSGESRYLEQIKKLAPVPEVLQLKVGALIMIRSNDPIGRWVNGSLGNLVGINKDSLMVDLHSGPTVEIEKLDFTMLDSEGKEVAIATNFPVNLAYASTIHKAQGLTLDEVMVDLRRLWEPGQAYVALSRARNAKGLHVSGWTPSSIKVDPQVSQFYRTLEAYERTCDSDKTNFDGVDLTATLKNDQDRLHD